MNSNTKRTISLAGGVVALASIGYSAYIASRRGIQIEIEHDFSVPGKDVIDLIKQVERETELVPFVSEVQVFDRLDNEVSYEVVSDKPVNWRVVYTKWWNYAGNWVAWKSLTGSYGVSHAGEIRFIDTEYGCRAKLISSHRFALPVLAGPATFLSKSFVKTAMEGWIKRLQRELRRKHVTEVQPNPPAPFPINRGQVPKKEGGVVQ